MEQFIKNKALELGFCAAGIANADASSSIDRYEEWLAKGHSAGMSYLSRNIDKRKDIRNLEPWARSVIVVAARYPLNHAPGKGFSTYCRGTDYHKVIKDKLTLLGEEIQKRSPNTKTRAFTDSAPILERELAIKSGIGWQGRHGQIIHETHGCCILLGELLTDLVLQATPPVRDRCGDCRICIQSCPTGALSETKSVDARKCRSYLTIEHKGVFTPEQGSLIGQSVFGCDICTAACPYNADTDNSRIIPELRERDLPSAFDILSMNKEDFDRQFNDTAVHRTGLNRLQRNAKQTIENQS